MDIYTYHTFRTNLPKEIMLFPELPMDAKQPSFLHHSDVKKYLEKYSDHYELSSCIQFGQLVERVDPIPLQYAPVRESSGVVDTVKWRVTTRNMKSGESKSEEFDFVFVCSG